MSQANTVTIKGANLFYGWGHGGRETTEQLTEWNGMSETSKLIEIIDFVESRADAIIRTLGDDAGSLNAKGLAGNILMRCNKIKGGATSIIELMQLGALIERVATESAVYSALKFNVKLKARSIKGGNESGKARKATAKERQDEILKQWHSLTNKEERARVKTIEARLSNTEFKCTERTIRRALKDAGIRG
ncbi:hypothetical protein CWE08_04375 [Aliidiomarina iranensis]|uniref:Uncharacterized protein n=1 Tax=Aliidiomarina iranensis TaxID=1434071 RepID=A0A432W0B4_9GAMM|nr:hypothetical protein [Aliidiomarina iranensis]RUO22422.1 hypothetical protein CWE08_04375 [Aliidiomarina iranensis]